MSAVEEIKCGRCRQILPATEEHWHPYRLANPQNGAYCKRCASIHGREWRLRRAKRPICGACGRPR